jgi:hypothetical protein
MYPHNILLTEDRVLFADWPHARLGAPFVDLLLLLSSAAASGIDPEPILTSQPQAAGIEPRTIDAVLAAHTGFCLAGALLPAPPGLEPIIEAKLSLGQAAITWLTRRIASRPKPTPSDTTRAAGGGQPADEVSGNLSYAGLAVLGEHVQDDVVGAGLQLLADPRGDGIRIAPDDQLVDEPVGEFGDVGVGKPHPGEARGVAG